METREIVAYALLATALAVGSIWLGFARNKRRLTKLRRRGIKRYER